MFIFLKLIILQFMHIKKKIYKATITIEINLLFNFLTLFFIEMLYSSIKTVVVLDI